MSKANFREDILDAADGEPIEAIIITNMNDVWWYAESIKGTVPEERVNTICSWEEAAPWLDYSYDDGFGGQDCHNVYAFTPTRVLYVHEYDGSTSLHSMPRSPEAFLAMRKP